MMVRLFLTDLPEFYLPNGYQGPFAGGGPGIRSGQVLPKAKPVPD